ncbi:NUDIX hydrolase [Candidatus Latescibacterota bacterium]
MKPRILKRSEKQISPWLRLVSKEVEFSPDRPVEVYHSVTPSDYITIFAETPTGLIPLVHQYRPAVETFTCELPAGLLEENEDPVHGCIRELKEETGLTAESATYLGSFFPDTGRLENTLHVCYIKTKDPDPEFIPETGIDVSYVNMNELKDKILAGEFRHLLHIAVITLIEQHLGK